jgi:release factor glutamine methyltransferase
LAGCDSPGLVSLVLLEHTLQQPKSWLLSHSEYKLTPQQRNALQESTQHYLQGTPLPYILGTWEFFGRSFIVTPDVLIPRPETEILVELALEHTRALQSPLVVDVGTGSGCIAISLAAAQDTATVLGVDLSLRALQIARRNAQRWDQSRVHFLQADLLSPSPVKFDLICANLPYIPTQALAGLSVSRWEPQLALDGGATGLESIHRLLAQAQSRLSPNSVILLEIESTHGTDALDAAQEFFPHARHRLVRDLAGHNRILEIHTADAGNPQDGALNNG